jgi:hypothetical protein
MSRILFQLTALSTTVFVITILSMVAMMLGDPAAPINIWFNRHGTVVLLTEVAAVVILGLAAMNADQRETRRANALASEESSKAGDKPEDRDQPNS